MRAWLTARIDTGRLLGPAIVGTLAVMSVVGLALIGVTVITPGADPDRPAVAASPVVQPWVEVPVTATATVQGQQITATATILRRNPVAGPVQSVSLTVGVPVTATATLARTATATLTQVATVSVTATDTVTVTETTTAPAAVAVPAS